MEKIQTNKQYQDYVDKKTRLDKNDLQKVVISKPSIIKLEEYDSINHYTSPINKNLGFDLTTVDETYIVSEIEKILGADNGFYYNCPIDNTIAINLNYDANQQTMLDGHLLYDQNNINNKFTVTEIDAKYLSKGITISQTSKLRRY